MNDRNLQMVRRAAITVPLFLITLLATQAFPLHDGLALTPPMGWYPWNEFECDQNEALVRRQADEMAKPEWKRAGWIYCGPDECWSEMQRGPRDTILPNKLKYPSGMDSLGRYIHSKGLKYAFYNCVGRMTCAQYPGSEAFMGKDARLFATAFKADYIKMDCCFITNETWDDTIKYRYKQFRDSLKATKRKVVYSICEYGKTKPWLWGDTVGHLWRTDFDICYGKIANWGGLEGIIDHGATLAQYAGPGHWNDADMMILGMKGLSNAQNRAHMAMWCIMASPLYLGVDMPVMSDTSKLICQNREVVAIDQDPLGIQGKRIKGQGNLEVWAKQMKPTKAGDTMVAVVAWNRGQAAATAITFTWAEIGLGLKAGGSYYVRDCWKHQNLGLKATGFTTPKLVQKDAGVFYITVKEYDSTLTPIWNMGPLDTGLFGATSTYRSASPEAPAMKLFNIRKSSSGVSITIPASGEYQFSLMTANGAVIERKQIHGPTSVYYASGNLPNGAYIVSVRHGKQFFSRSFVSSK